MDNCSVSCPRESQLEGLVRNYLASNEEYLLDDVVKAGEPLVRHFAVLFSGGRPIEDYMQAGYEGLLKAVKNFNADYGNSFSTYAGHCIIGEIKHYIRREASYYMPVCITELQSKVESLMEEYLVESVLIA
jgi:RNA polymerase sigma-B factor